MAGTSPQGATYNNFGVHGAGSANAADALAAVNQFVFHDRTLQARDLLAALNAGFDGYGALRCKLVEEAPKVGNDDPRADDLLVFLFNSLAEACEGCGVTPRGGLLRPGTGSAMYYIWLAQGHAGMREPVVGATAEGRLKGEPLGGKPGAEPGRAGARADQRFAVLRQDRLPAHLQRRPHHAGNVQFGLSGCREAVRKVAMLVRAFAQRAASNCS